MKRLIVNGDDFGLNERCSRAIAEAFERKLITDTTIMANGGFFDGALRLAKANGFDGKTGIHLNLTEGSPLTEEIKSITDFVHDGVFCKDYLKSKRELSLFEQNAVYLELSAQIKKVLDSGIKITHADSHHYIHNLPHIAPVAAKACREHGINKIRLARNLGGNDNENNNIFWKKHGFVTTDFFGRITDVSVESIPDKTEIMVHPDYDRNGVLIDRRGMENGFPSGGKILALWDKKDVVLKDYASLEG